jgi:hypothetical protein
MKILNAIALALVVIGGINWGLVGLFDLDLVAALFGGVEVLANLIYVLVGVAAIYCLYLFKPVLAYPTG